MGTSATSSSGSSNAGPPRQAWSFLVIVAAVVVATVVTTVGRLPTNSRGYYNRGVSDSHDGRYESAIRNFDRSLELDPTRTDALVARSVAWNRVGHSYRALADADSALAREPDSSRALLARGQALRRIGLEDEALDALERSVAVDPHFGRAVLADADAMFDAGRFREALERYRAVGVMRRGDDTLYFAPMLVWSSRALAGDLDGARGELREMYAAALADRLRLRRAVAAAEATGPALAADAADAVVLWVTAVDHLARGDRAGAIDALRSAWTKSPAESWVHERAWSLLERVTLGMRVQEDNRDISTSFSFGPGITVSCVRDGGPAGEGGLAAGDRLLKVDGVEATAARVDDVVAHGSIGSIVRLEATRRGEPVQADVLVGGREGVRLATSAPTR